jgi:glycosyltransferase involved in cell wall biosynthesis
MAKSLFITYDGLTDPLGQSQILPYLTGLTKYGHRISILSCEKEDRFLKNRALIESICKEYQIRWTPLPFHRKPPIISKYYDLYRLTTTAFALHDKEQFDIIHCRSYLSAEIGRKLKRKKGVKYLFDMRGFWVDERVDGGLWDTSKFFYRLAYKKWKKKEAKLIQEADHIISLTEAGKKEIARWPSYQQSPVTVIPCSADMELFNLTNETQKQNARQQLGIDENAFVLSYLGSLGTWYLLDEMLILFRAIKSEYPGAKFLLLTPDDAEKVYRIAGNLGLQPSDFIIRFAQRKEVPALMKASDVSVSFIKEAYSKIASSPTKLGELLAMGIPVICNDIGDVAKIIEISRGGIILNDFTQDSMNKALEYIRQIKNNGVHINRQAVENYYSLQQAISHYHQVYQELMALP